MRLKRSKEDSAGCGKKNDSTAFNGIRSIKKSGKVATISLELAYPRFDTVLVLEAMMRNKGSYWQLFDISNIISHSQTLELLEAARVERLNELVLKKFRESLPVTNIKVDTKEFGYYSKWNEHIFNLELTNTSTDKIEYIEYEFYINDSSGNLLMSGYINEKVALTPGEKYRHQAVDRLSYDVIDTIGINVGFNRVKIGFEDGRKLHWREKWDNVSNASE